MDKKNSQRGVRNGGLMTNPSFNIITLGCKVNQYESAYLEDALVRAGCRQAVNGEMADISLINTCIVTQRAAHQSRQAIRKAIRENPKGIVAAIGCYAQVFPDELSQIQGLGLIADNTVKGKIPGLLLGLDGSEKKSVFLNDFEPGTPFEFLPIHRFSDRTRAYLKIQDGCESFCSYCIVAFARGPYRSLSPERVLSVIESFVSQGYKEIVLTGIHLGKYGVDLKGGMNLTQLLRAIGKEGLPARIRLSSLEPNEIYADLMEIVATEPWLCRHFHIPLQSGDDGILKKMNRHYTRREFADIVESIHARIPFAAIGVDVMAGFPGEDSVAHENTRALINDLPISYLHVFPFSRRPGTAAAVFDGQIDPVCIKERSKKLRDLGQLKRTLFYRSCLNNTFWVLAESWYSKENKKMKGMSDNYVPVVFPTSQDSRNRMVRVRLEKVANHVVIGSAL